MPGLAWRGVSTSHLPHGLQERLWGVMLTADGPRSTWALWLRKPHRCPNKVKAQARSRSVSWHRCTCARVAGKSSSASPPRGIKPSRPKRSRCTAKVSSSCDVPGVQAPPERFYPLSLQYLRPWHSTYMSMEPATTQQCPEGHVLLTPGLGQTSSRAGDRLPIAHDARYRVGPGLALNMPHRLLVHRRGHHLREMCFSPRGGRGQASRRRSSVYMGGEAIATHTPRPTTCRQWGHRCASRPAC